MALARFLVYSKSMVYVGDKRRWERGVRYAPRLLGEFLEVNPFVLCLDIV
ncbi:hypothetical protein NORO109296_11630 [Nocardiopsis rhodophaea]